ncbi:hypothetical protein U1763_10540 [Sphingomonas sp. LB2R24]|uniref:hypothetical protein n=1 Tax=Sphingomonas sorbitolis TaxID=3096165 RepID=UPI002FC77FE2
MAARLRWALAPADPREALRVAVAEGGDSLTALSRMINRSPGYLGRFIKTGRPTALSEDDHRILGEYLGAGKMGLGIRDLWVPRD